MMTEKIKVLFISQWYPHRYDPMFGLFVRKHAEAVSLYCDVQVLYVHADNSITNFDIITSNEYGFKETIIYYPSAVSKAKKIFNYLKAYRKGFKLVNFNGNKPDIIHANILTRTGAIALFQCVLYEIPYIITEHWSRYLPQRNNYKGFLRKVLTKIVVKNAAAVLPVSENLKEAMLMHGLKNKNYQILNNVVENFFFELPSTKLVREKKRIIHISCFDETVKNIKGLLRSIQSLSKIRNDFELILVGDGIDYEDILIYSETLGFDGNTLQFIGNKTPKEVAFWLQNSDVFLLFSDAENSPVVISESLACGKPVISSNVGGISEHINSSNGLLVSAGDEKALIEKIDYMLDNFQNYNTDQIKKAAYNKYSYESVGSSLLEIYKSILK